MKNMVVLRNLPSNMIEEAFVVLKNNVKIHRTEAIENKNGKQKIKEGLNNKVKNAEYVDEINKKKLASICNNKNLALKCKRLKAISCFLGAFSILTTICILFG